LLAKAERSNKSKIEGNISRIVSWIRKKPGILVKCDGVVQEALCNTVAKSLPIRLPAKDGIEILNSLYPNGKSICFNFADCVFLNHLTPIDADKLSENERQHWLNCLVNCHRSKVVSGAGGKDFLSSGTIVDAVLYALDEITNVRLADKELDFSKLSDAVFVCLISLLDKNYESVTNEKYSILLYDSETVGLIPALGIPVELPCRYCDSLVRSLFPEGMFHLFSFAEYMLIMHLSPQKTRWDVFFSLDKEFLEECIVGAMRTKEIVRYVQDSCIDVSMGEYLGLRPESRKLQYSENSFQFSGHSGVFTLEECGDIAAGLVRKVLDSDDQKIFTNSSLDWSQVPIEVQEALKSAFLYNVMRVKPHVERELAKSKVALENEEKERLIDRAACGLPLQLEANFAMILIYKLFPKGMFHLFNKKERILMNMLEPSGRKLFPSADFPKMPKIPQQLKLQHTNVLGVSVRISPLTGVGCFRAVTTRR
jgi:hypothetical protein